MKISFVSSQAVSQAMRYQMQRMQADLFRNQQEVVTGRAADVGLALGGRTGYSISLSREVDRLKGLIDANQLASSRLSATQIGMQQMSDAAQELLDSFATAITGSTDPAISKGQAKAVLERVTSILNQNLNGEHLFAGINTDARPIQDFYDPASPNRIAFDAAFETHFGFPQSDPAASGINAAQMTDFLTTVVEPQFLSGDWYTNWSTATDQQIISRITLTETAETSVSANNAGIRKLMMAATTVATMLEMPIGKEARDAVLKKATSQLGEAIVDLVNQQAFTGVTQQRVTNASDRLAMQRDLFTRTVSDMEGVDPYEAANRVSGLLAQIEVSYSLTARMQNLSLVRYLS